LEIKDGIILIKIMVVGRWKDKGIINIIVKEAIIIYY
jgi:hypothetical protein